MSMSHVMTGGRKEYVLIHWGSRRKGSSKRIKRLLLIYHEPASSHTKSSLGDSHSETHRRPMDLLSHRAIRRIGPSDRRCCLQWKKASFSPSGDHYSQI